MTDQTTLDQIAKRRPIEAAAIAAMTDDQRFQILAAMERGFARGAPWWRRLLARAKQHLTEALQI